MIKKRQYCFSPLLSGIVVFLFLVYNLYFKVKGTPL